MSQPAGQTSAPPRPKAGGTTPSSGEARRWAPWAEWLAPLWLVLFPLLTRPFSGPYDLAYKSDPAYPYLFNALNILAGQMPGHTDHPGTPLQMLAGGVVWLTWAVRRLAGQAGDLAAAVLADPETYCLAINFTLTVLAALAWKLLARVIRRESGQPWLGLVAQLAFLGSQTLLLTLTQIRTETLLLSLAPLYAAAWWSLTTGAGREAARPWARALWLGALAGLAAATKITSAPLWAFFLLLPGWGPRLAAGGAAVGAFVLGTAPIWPQYPRMWTWFTDILTHSGRYGAGAGLLPSLGELAANLGAILRAEPLLPVTLGLAAAALILTWQREGFRRAWQGDGRALALGLVVVGFQILLVMKHYGLRYLVPALLICPPILALAWRTAAPSLARAGANLRARAGLGLAALVLLAGSALWAWYDNELSLAQTYQAQQRLEELAQRQGCRIIPYYVYSGREFALYLGDRYSRFTQDALLARMYPDYREFNAWRGEFTRFGGAVDPGEMRAWLARGEKLCLLGSYDFPAPPGMDLEPLGREGMMKLWRITSVGPARRPAPSQK
ncbi:MAG: hypothetical protein KQJ78_07350 [Deltaproteobacteria bacterium]|nr:hypothetical protein [Deltaproteobacteria bacterium]